MDPKRMKEAYQRLDLLDERLTYRVRSKNSIAMRAPSSAQLDERLRDLAEMTLELKDVLRELFLAMAKKPRT